MFTSDFVVNYIAEHVTKVRWRHRNSVVGRHWHGRCYHVRVADTLIQTCCCCVWMQPSGSGLCLLQNKEGPLVSLVEVLPDAASSADTTAAGVEQPGSIDVAEAHPAAEQQPAAEMPQTSEAMTEAEPATSTAASAEEAPADVGMGAGAHHSAVAGACSTCDLGYRCIRHVKHILTESADWEMLRLFCTGAGFSMRL